MSRSWWRKLFGREDAGTRKTASPKRNLGITRLEDRLAPATFAEVGTQLNLNLNVAGEAAAIVSNGTSYTLTLTGGTWSGTNSAKVTGNGTSVLTVTSAGLAALNTINLTDSVAGTAVKFNDSGANSYSDSFTVNLDDAAAGTIVFSGATSFSGANNISVSTTSSIAVNVGASLSTNSGDITLSADDMAINASINAGTGIVTLQQASANRQVDLGTNTGGRLGLTQAELNQVTGSLLRIGNASLNGDIKITANIAAAASFGSTLSLRAGNGSIDQFGGSITATSLAVQAFFIDLTNAANNVTNLAGITSGFVQSGFQFTNSGNLNVATVDGVVGIKGTNTNIPTPFGDVILTGGAGSTLTVSQAITTPNGRITLTFDDMAINAAITAPSLGAFLGIEGIVTLAPASAGRVIDLGTDTAGRLGLTDTELDNVTAGVVLRIGNAANTGGIIITSPITAPAGYGTLHLTTGGGISDGTPTDTTIITVTNLALEASTGIGAADDLDTQATKLAFKNAGGAVNVDNVGALTIDAVDGSATSSNTGTTTNISAQSPLTIAVNTVTAGDSTFSAGETADAPTFADKLTVNAGVTVEVTAGNLTMHAGDDIVLNAGSVVKADTAGKTIAFAAGFSDLDGSGAIVTDATSSILATNLGLAALTGVGSAGAAVITTVSNLEANTGTGGIFVNNTGDLAIGNVGSMFGVRTTTSGDVSIKTTGNLTLAETGPGYIVSAATGNAYLEAGVGKDLTATVNNDAVQALLGDVTLKAGQDIKLGTAGANFDNDVDADGSIFFTAGRDIVIDGFSDIRADGFGNATGGQVSLIAGRNVTLGPVGNDVSVTTQGGPITVTTGAGGVFTLTNFSGLSSNSGDITVNADQIVMGSNGDINAGAGCVILQPVTAGTKIDLGGAGGAGTIGLTDAELDLILAGVLQIGNGTTGSITITAPITIASGDVPILDLRTAASISTAGGTLAAGSLVFDAGTNVTLTGGNSIGTIAGTANGKIDVANAGLMAIGAVTNCDSVTINGISSNGNDITIAADDLEISEAVTATGACAIITTNAGGLINLGTEVGGSLSLKDSEIQLITSADLQIGDAAAGAITVAGAIAPNVPTHLISAAAISGGGSITTAQLALTSGDSISLTGANDVDVLAGTAKNSFAFTDADGLDFGSVTVCGLTETGVTSTLGNVALNSGALLNLTNDVKAAGNVTLNTTSVGVTQTTGIVLAAGLELLGTGSFTLTTATNNVANIAANVTGPINYRDADALTVGTVNTAGINTNGNALTLQANGINQTAALSASVFTFSGNGNFIFANANNDVTSVTSNTTGGQVIFRDANDLAIAAGGITTGGNALSILTGRSFTLSTGVTIDLGGVSGGVTAGLNDVSKADKSTTVTLNGTVIAHPANGFRLDGGIGSNTFVVTPSTTIPIFIFGHSPTPAELSPTIRGDALSLNTSALGAQIGLNNFDPVNGNGVFVFTDPNNGAIEKARPVIFNSIEQIKGLSLEAAAVQTAPANYQLIASGYLNGQPFTGGFVGTLPPVAPFLISPQFTSPVGPFTAPRISVGDIDGDGLPDLVIGFGRNSGSPLVSVVKGSRLFDSSKAGQPLQTTDIMTQFYAYNPAYQGGVFVSAADLDGDGRAEIITGAGESGGPHVKIFKVDASKSANANATIVGEFFAYAANFTGGVRVAAGDVNGDGQVDIITAAGIGGGPHVKVFNGVNATKGPGTPTLIGQFFAYSANFLGGVFVDAGDYDSDGYADILTGAGFGGGPHVRVFDGETLAKTGTATVLNEFFDDLPSVGNPSPFQDDLSAFSAGVTSVGFANFEDNSGPLDIFVGSGVGRRTRGRIYKNGSHTPVSIGGKPVDFLSGGTNYQFDNRRDGANVAVGGAFIS